MNPTDSEAWISGSTANFHHRADHRWVQGRFAYRTRKCWEAYEGEKVGKLLPSSGAPLKWCSVVSDLSQEPAVRWHNHSAALSAQTDAGPPWSCSTARGGIYPRGRIPHLIEAKHPSNLVKELMLNGRKRLHKYGRGTAFIVTKRVV